MRISLLILMLALLSSFRILPDNETDKLVMKAAEGQLPIFLAKLTFDNAYIYGFSEDDDLDDCTIGKPFRVLVFNADFYMNDFDENKNYIVIKNEWRVPVMINGKYRCMLTVGGNPGNYAVSNMGDTTLAKELRVTTKGTGENDTYYLLRIPRLSADFYVNEPDNSLNEAVFVPLESATDTIAALKKTNKTSFTLTEVETMVKEAINPRPTEPAPIIEPAPDKKKPTPVKKQKEK